MRNWDSLDDEDASERLGRAVIGQGIKRGRLDQGLSQRQLAFRVGLNQSTISRLETGHLRTMGMVTLARIIGVLRIGPGFVFGGEPLAPTRRMPGARAA
jgi:transcriptional regulator with XRE-family HTH domain